jgi:hypothetical protein
MCPDTDMQYKTRQNLIRVTNLVKYFPIQSGILQRTSAWVKAVDDVSFFVLGVFRGNGYI